MWWKYQLNDFVAFSFTDSMFIKFYLCYSLFAAPINLLKLLELKVQQEFISACRVAFLLPFFSEFNASVFESVCSNAEIFVHFVTQLCLQIYVWALKTIFTFLPYVLNLKCLINVSIFLSKPAPCFVLNKFVNFQAKGENTLLTSSGLFFRLQKPSSESQMHMIQLFSKVEFELN